MIKMADFNSNPFSYEQRIGGLRPARLAAIILSVLVSSVFYFLIGQWAILLLILFLALGVLEVNGKTLFLVLLNSMAGLMTSRDGFITASGEIKKYGKAAFVKKDGILYLPVMLNPVPLIGVSPRKREEIYSGLRELLNNTGCNISIVTAYSHGPAGNSTVHAEGEYGKFVNIVSGGQPYYSPVLFLSRNRNNQVKDLKDRLISDLMKISGYLESTGTGWHFPEEYDVLKALNLVALNTSTDTGKGVSYSLGRRYFSLNGTFHMAVNITDFRNGPARLLSQGIDSLDFPCIVSVKSSSYEKEKARKLLKYMISERATDLKIHRSRSSSRNTNAERQLTELNELLRSLESSGDRVLDMSISLILSSEDPADLTRKFHRITSILQFLGLDYAVEENLTGRKLNRLMPLGKSRNHYLTNTSNFARIMPVFFTPRPEKGIIIGLSSTTEKPEMFSFFGRNSFNVMILGETGSGKSHFSKILLMRALLSGSLKNVLIIDPLQEYRPEYFQDSSRVVSLAAGDYLESGIDGSSESLEYLSALITAAIRVSKSDEVRLRSAISSCLNRGVSGIAEILEEIEEKLPDYSEEVRHSISAHFRNPVHAHGSSERVTVIRFSPQVQAGRELQLLQIAAYAYFWMGHSTEEKAILIDEAHVMLEEESITRIMDSLVRNSRHYSTSVINITQNFSDFQRTEFTRNIVNNTAEFFVFRNKTDRAEFESIFGDLIPDTDFLQNLKGGKEDRYSECLRINGSRAYPMKVVSTKAEMDRITG